MKCFSCKFGDMQKAITTYTVSSEQCIIVIRNVPCLKCDQCGEELFSSATLEKIEHIVDLARNISCEVSIIDYGNVA